MTYAKTRRTKPRAKAASATLSPAAPSLVDGGPSLVDAGLVLHQAQGGQAADEQGAAQGEHQAQGGAALWARVVEEAKAHPDKLQEIQTRIVLHADAKSFPPEIRAVLPEQEVTREGFRRVWGVASRGNCIYHYSNIGGKVHIYRPGDVVFGPAFCRSFLGLPFTLWHPQSGAQPANAREVTHGSIFDVTPFPELGIVRMGVVLYTPEVMEAFDSGMTALSTGEWNQIMPIPGELDGEPYDAILYAASGNHLALVDIGAAGPLAHLRSNAAAPQDTAAPQDGDGSARPDGDQAALSGQGVGYIVHAPPASNNTASNGTTPASNNTASPGLGASPPDAQPGKVAPTQPAAHEVGGQGDSPMKKIKFKMKDGTEYEVEVPEAAAAQIMAAIEEKDGMIGQMQAEIDTIKALSEEKDKEPAAEPASEDKAMMAVKHATQATAQLVSLNGGKTTIPAADGKPVELTSFGSVEEMQRAYLAHRLPKMADKIKAESPDALKARLDTLQAHAERATSIQAKLETHSGKTREAAQDTDALAQHEARQRKLDEARAAKRI